jgi:hypothetical protein
LLSDKVANLVADGVDVAIRHVVCASPACLARHAVEAVRSRRPSSRAAARRSDR